MRLSALSLIGLTILSGCATSTQNQQGYAYGTKSVYQSKQLAPYQAAPTGYSLVFTELVARHGSRALSSPKYDDISLKIWRKAKAMNALTPEGELLGAEIERMMLANQKMGYGNLSQLGQEEHQQLGQRLVARDHSLFTHAVAKQQPIVVEYSGRERAKDSALAFSRGMAQALPALRSLTSAPQINKAELYFHKSKANKAYQEYKEHSPQLRTKIDSIIYSATSHKLAQQVLHRIYKPEFVAALTQGQYFFLRQGKEQAKSYNDVDAALNLFNLYLIAPGMRYEAGSQPWQFAHYFTPEETQWFSYVMDAEDFYEKGPSLKNTQITYKMAEVLEQDFFDSIEAVRSGRSNMAAKIRFGHAETVIPFAALMQLEGSNKNVAAGKTYTRQNNPWRGAWVAPLSGNIQWDVYRNQQNQWLVRMLYNERESAFKASCKPIAGSSYFYSFDELKRCYAQN